MPSSQPCRCLSAQGIKCVVGEAASKSSSSSQSTSSTYSSSSLDGSSICRKLGGEGNQRRLHLARTRNMAMKLGRGSPHIAPRGGVDRPQNFHGKEGIRNEANPMITDNLAAFNNRGVPVVNAWMIVSFLVKMYHQGVSLKSPSTIMYLACLSVSCFTDVVMNTFIKKQLEKNKVVVTGESSWRWIQTGWMIVYLSTILRISAATALMLFFNTTDTVTVFVLFGLVLVLVIYFFCQMFGSVEVPGYSWVEEFKELLNRRFEMSALVVAPSVAGLSGKVLGYVGGSSDLTGGHTAVAPECFLFYSAVSSLLVVLFCTVPPSLSTDVTRMAEVYIPSIAYSALFFLVVATVVAAEKILKEYVFLVCCLIAIIALFFYLHDARAEDRPDQQQANVNDERQDEAKTIKYISTACISSILLAIMAIHSSYGIGSGSAVSLSWSWIAFVTSALCSILSHTVCICIVGLMTEGKRYKRSRKFWTAVTFLAITITVVFAVFVICLHLDEVINIF